MILLQIFFWLFLFVVFYTYVGYAMLLYVLVKVKEAIYGKRVLTIPEELPEVTLMIAAYNEQDVVEEKMQNCKELNYPPHLLKIVWVTDGSTDKSNEMLGQYDNVRVLFDSARMGKSAALNRGVKFVDTDLVIFTDANTMLCPDAVKLIVAEFTDSRVGCVAGEKRVYAGDDAAATEGLYWKYESKVKDLDYRLYSAVGAAGELFAVRRLLFEELPSNTLLDDFVLSMRIAAQGYKIAYCKDAYAIEPPSADIEQESKRKVRIAAGGIQSIIMLRGLLNIFRHGVLSFQYISHRVLRWSVTPIMLMLLLPINIAIVSVVGAVDIYALLLLMQFLFYMASLIGYILDKAGRKNRLFFVFYYFIFMNISVIRGFGYLIKRKGSISGVWEKADRRKK